MITGSEIVAMPLFSLTMNSSGRISRMQLLSKLKSQFDDFSHNNNPPKKDFHFLPMKSTCGQALSAVITKYSLWKVMLGVRVAS